jgi:Domain of unknown function (DUF3471)
VVAADGSASDPASRKPNATYGLGWTLDSYNGHRRVSHGGYLHDVHSEVLLFPDLDIGVVAFVNFGASMLALLVAEHAFDAIMGLQPVSRLSAKLAEYRQGVAQQRQQRDAIPKVLATLPSLSSNNYGGRYWHPGYGPVEISDTDAGLMLSRGEVKVGLEHWHYDTWMATHEKVSRVHFEVGVEGHIVSLSIALEPCVSPIRFVRQSG